MPNNSFEVSSRSEYADILNSENAITHVEFASAVLASRRTAINLTLDQICEMAAAILVLNHNLTEANERMISMLAAPEPVKKKSARSVTPVQKRVPAPEVIAVPVQLSNNPSILKALEALVAAHNRLDQEKFSSGEKHAHQEFEKAAAAVANLCTISKGKAK